MVEVATSSRHWHRVALLLSAVTFIASAGCARDKAPQAAAPPDRPNIIVLTVDTLRADRMELYGYSRPTMPAIAEFAKTAVVFDNAIVPRGSTRPSYASMLTGLYPFHHGVRSHGVVLHEDLSTLPERLKDQGYHTAAFVSNSMLLADESGCNQGFDIYDDHMDEPEGNRPRYERTAGNTLAAIQDWLDSAPPQPFFLLTNFIDPHGPYRPPPRLRKLFVSQRQRAVPPGKIPQYQATAGVNNFFDFVDRYDAEIRYVDEALGALIEDFKRRGLWESALVVFTADHGESFGEHGQFFEHHGHVFEETTRVPLAIRLPKGARSVGSPPGRVSAVCSPMDLMPTVLDLLAEPMGGLCDGQSLLPVLQGHTPAERFVFIEFPDVATWHVSLPDIYAIRSTTHKLMRMLDSTTGELKQQGVFHIARDPLERAAASFDKRSPLHRELAEQLDAMIAQVGAYQLPFTVAEYEPPPPPGAATQPSATRQTEVMTPEQIERLRSLGYIP